MLSFDFLSVFSPVKKELEQFPPVEKEKMTISVHSTFCTPSQRTALF